MKVTAWKNGTHRGRNTSYGLKIAFLEDRDRHFERIWQTVFVQLPNGETVEVNIDKDSFWNNSCRELIHLGIRDWLFDSDHAPWPDRQPPSFFLLPVRERSFVVS